jgi:hypothetical protein
VARFLIAVGIALMLWALMMDVSYHGVFNLHKASQQNALLLFGGIVLLAGVILIRRDTTPKQDAEKDSGPAHRPAVSEFFESINERIDRFNKKVESRTESVKAASASRERALSVREVLDRYRELVKQFADAPKLVMAFTRDESAIPQRIRAGVFASVCTGWAIGGPMSLVAVPILLIYSMNATPSRLVVARLCVVPVIALPFGILTSIFSAATSWPLVLVALFAFAYSWATLSSVVSES